MIWWILGGVFVAVAILGWSLLAMAGQADRKIEEMRNNDRRGI